MRLSIFSLVMLMCGFAFAQAQSGVFMVVKGDVKVLSPGKGPFPAKVGTKVSVGDAVETGVDSRAKITMIDRNMINLLPSSKIEIAKYFSDAKTGVREVEIKLEKGKVRNDVENVYDGEKTKFELKTPTAVAGVRGTKFVASYDSSTKKTDVVTLEGKVKFSSTANGKTLGSVEIKVGETATATPGAPPEPPKSVPASELKQIERESTASNQPTKSLGDVASNTESGGDKKDKEKDKDKKDNNDKGDKPNNSGERGVASEDGKKGPPPPPASMDGQFNPTVDGVTPPPMGPPPGSTGILPPKLPLNPIQNPVVRDIIRDGAAKTKVIVKPQY